MKRNIANCVLAYVYCTVQYYSVPALEQKSSLHVYVPKISFVISRKVGCLAISPCHSKIFCDCPTVQSEYEIILAPVKKCILYRLLLLKTISLNENLMASVTADLNYQSWRLQKYSPHIGFFIFMKNQQYSIQYTL